MRDLVGPVVSCRLEKHANDIVYRILTFLSKLDYVDFEKRQKNVYANLSTCLQKHTNKRRLQNFYILKQA